MKNIEIAFRSLFKKGRSNGIKILSLGVGLAMGCVLISKVCFEYSFNKSYPDYKRIYSLQENLDKLDTNLKRYGQVSGSVAVGAQAEIPAVEEATRFTRVNGKNTILYLSDKSSIAVDNIIMADTNLFDLLPQRVLAGNWKETMARANYAMVSRRVAEMLGGIDKAIGKTFTREDDPATVITVGGIYENIPENTDYRYDVALSIEGYYEWSRNNWMGTDRYTGLVRLRPGVTAEDMLKPLRAMQERHWDMDGARKAGVDSAFYSLLPLTDVHTDQDDGAKNMTLLIGMLAFVLIFNAVMNYILIVLSTLVNRTKEIAVHKCYGASGRNLFGMVMSEALVHILISLVLAAFLILLLRTKVEGLLSASLGALFAPQTLLILALVCIAVFFITGLVPAYIFQHVPVASAFRNFRESRHSWKLALLFVQFMATAFLVSFLFVIDRQYNHLININMGYAYKNLVYCTTDGVKPETRRVAMNELSKLSEVDKVSCSRTLPYGGASGNNVSLPGEDKELFNIADLYYVSDNFFPLMEIPIVEGEAFTPDSSSTHKVMVSEQFVKKMELTAGWKGSPLGKQVRITEHVHNKNEALTISGVYKDIVIGSAAMPDNRPSVIFYGNNDYTSIILVKLHKMTPENYEKVKKTIETVIPDRNLTVKLYRDDMFDLYKDTRNFCDAILYGGLVTLIIALIGLLGYTSDETNRRGREIAIRKVNGATAGDILKMISRDVTFIAAPAILIGVGAAYYLSHNWMSYFADKASISILLFVAGALVVYLLVVLCVIWRAWVAANANPVVSLKAD